MKHDIKVPAVGESITEATIGAWQKKSGDWVQRNDVLLMLETDKASVEVVAENEGLLNISVQAGKTIPIGSVVGFIEAGARPQTTAPAAASAASTTAATAAPTPSGNAQPAAGLHPDLKNHLSPAVQKIATENKLNTTNIEGSGKGGRLTKEDALMAVQKNVGAPSAQPVAKKAEGTPTAAVAFPLRSLSTKQGEQKRVPMTTIRKRIAERLLQSQQTTATLTTFNEIDMTKVMDLRNRYKDKFKEKYGLSLGFMGFFVRASVEALKSVPAVNGLIDGTDMIYNNFFNIGVAVGTEKGLIVPVIRDADMLSIAEIENAIKMAALKARDGKITIDDLSGGTFTISNGGVYGSLMSTPILNPPQSGILGMHKIEERPRVINGKIEVRQMMYVALSYDHRVIDGKEAVTFLVKIKEGIEDPERLLLEI